jgi:hypothetical protein
VNRSVFISHAGPDSPAAHAVADRLRADGFGVELDRERLRTGDSFLSFMEKALSTCDYCLLLWSQAAAERKYVQLEWEAALYRTIEESRRFLLIGRLQDHPVPALLGPRLRVELFPDSAEGLDELVALLREDGTAESASGRRVGRAAAPTQEDPAGVEVYVTSEMFGLTLPLRWDLQVPCGVHTDRLTRSLGLPRQHDHQGVMGVRYTYGLALDDTPLSPTGTLAEQGVVERSVLWLEVEMKPYAAGREVEGELAGARLRGEGGFDQARRQLLDAVNRAGLGV